MPICKNIAVLISIAALSYRLLPISLWPQSSGPWDHNAFGPLGSGVGTLKAPRCLEPEQLRKKNKTTNKNAASPQQIGNGAGPVVIVAFLIPKASISTITRLCDRIQG